METLCCDGRIAPWMASVTFGGDLKTVFIGLCGEVGFLLPFAVAGLPLFTGILREQINLPDAWGAQARMKGNDGNIWVK